MTKNKAAELHAMARALGFLFVTYQGKAYSVRALAKIALGIQQEPTQGKRRSEPPQQSKTKNKKIKVKGI